MNACQECGNDDATWELCSDCLRPGRDGISRVIAECLGGPASDYDWISDAILARLF